MITEEELVKYAKEKNVNCYYAEVTASERIELKEKNVLDLLEFAFQNHIGNLFYEFIFINPNYMIIDTDLIRKNVLYEQYAALLKDKIEEYNNHVRSYNYELPYAMVAHCIYEGKIISVIESNVESFDGLIDMSAKEAFETLCADNNEILEDAFSSYKKQLDLLREELKEELIQTGQLAKLTNEKLRNGFARRMFNEEKYKKYEECFGYTGDMPSINEFLDEIYKEYKSQTKKEYKIEMEGGFF